jgi:hypothetical protein
MFSSRFGLICLITLTLGFTGQLALADSKTNPSAKASDGATANIFSDAGFVACLPAVKTEALISEVNTLQARLEERQGELAAQIGSGLLGKRDIVIAAIMPGGLLYAAYKQGMIEQHKDELAQVHEDLSALSVDLAALQDRAAASLLAQAR